MMPSKTDMNMMPSKPGAINIGPMNEQHAELTYKHQVCDTAVHSNINLTDQNISNKQSIHNNMNQKQSAVFGNNRLNYNSNLCRIDEINNEHIERREIENESVIQVEEHEYINDIPLAAMVYEENNLPLVYATATIPPREYNLKKLCKNIAVLSILIIAIIISITIIATSKNRDDTGTCGNGAVGDGICSDGTCCSSYGYCGTTVDHCGGESGTCGNGTVGDGICGGGNVSHWLGQIRNIIIGAFGKSLTVMLLISILLVAKCCSVHGYCGTTVDHCSTSSSNPLSNSSTTTEPISPTNTNPPSNSPTTSETIGTDKPSVMKPTAYKSITPHPVNTDPPSNSTEPVGSDIELFIAVDQFLNGGDNKTQVVNQYGNIESWDVSKIQNFSMLFSTERNPLAISFNEDISRWDVSDATTMFNMFYYATLFNAYLALWNVSNVVDMEGMFHYATSFVGSGIDNWQTSRVSNMVHMFKDAMSFNADLSLWNVGNLINVEGMFDNAQLYNGAGIGEWDTSKVESMIAAFYEAPSFNADLSNWDISKVKSMKFMFSGASNFEGNGINLWDTSQVEDMSIMFRDTFSFDADLTQWNVSNVQSMSSMFEGASSFRGTGLDTWNIGKVNDTSRMFRDAILFDADLSGWDISSLNNVACMFTNATSFRNVSWMNDGSC